MALSDQFKLDRLFKLSNNRAQTSIDKKFFEEGRVSDILIHANDVWADEVDSDPAQAVLDGIAILHTQLILVEDITVGGRRAYQARVGSIGTGDPITDFISPKYGQQYTVRLYDSNGSEIPFTDAMDWIFDYKAGILTIQDFHSKATPFKITAYQYVGGTLGAGGSGGGAGKLRATALDPEVGFLDEKVDATTFQIDGASFKLQIRPGSITEDLLDTVPWNKVSKIGSSLADLESKNYSDLDGAPDLNSFVTLTTAQTITGTKTFTQNTTFTQNLDISGTLSVGSNALEVNGLTSKVGIAASPGQQVLTIGGGIEIGTVSEGSGTPGAIRWTGTDFQGYNGARWVTFLGSGSGEIVSDGSVILHADHDQNFVGSIAMYVGGIEGMQLLRSRFGSNPIDDRVLIGIGKEPQKQLLEVASAITIGSTDLVDANIDPGTIKYDDTLKEFLGYVDGEGWVSFTKGTGHIHLFTNIFEDPSETRNLSTVLLNDFVHKTDLDEDILGNKTFLGTTTTFGNNIVVTNNATFANGNIFIDNGQLSIGVSAGEEKLTIGGALVLGDSVAVTPEEGTIRYIGTDFEGYTEFGWKSLTSIVPTGLISATSISIVYDSNGDDSVTDRFIIRSGADEVFSIDIDGNITVSSGITLGESSTTVEGTIYYDSTAKDAYLVTDTETRSLIHGNYINEGSGVEVPGYIRFFNGEFFGYDGTNWRSFQSSADHEHFFDKILDVSQPEENIGDTTYGYYDLNFVLGELVHAKGKKNPSTEHIYKWKNFVNKFTVGDTLIYAETSASNDGDPSNDPDSPPAGSHLNKVGIGVVPEVQKLEVAGAIQIGNTGVATQGTLRWTGTDIQVAIQDENFSGDAPLWLSLTQSLYASNTEVNFFNDHKVIGWYTDDQGAIQTSTAMTVKSITAYTDTFGNPVRDWIVGIGKVPTKNKLELDGGITLGGLPELGGNVRSEYEILGTIHFKDLGGGQYDFLGYTHDGWVSLTSLADSHTHIFDQIFVTGGGEGIQSYLDDNFVHTTGNLTESINGSKTFESTVTIQAGLVTTGGINVGDNSIIAGELTVNSEYFKVGNNTLVVSNNKAGIGKIAGVEKLEVAGAINLQSASGTDEGTIQYTSISGISDIYGRVDGEWKSLTKVTGGSLSGVDDVVVTYDSDDNTIGSFIVNKGTTSPVTYLSIDNDGKTTLSGMELDTSGNMTLGSTNVIVTGSKVSIGTGNDSNESLHLGGAIVIGPNYNGTIGAGGDISPGTVFYDTSGIEPDLKVWIGDASTGSFKSLTTVANHLHILEDVSDFYEHNYFHLRANVPRDQDKDPGPEYLEDGREVISVSKYWDSDQTFRGTLSFGPLGTFNGPGISMSTNTDFINVSKTVLADGYIRLSKNSDSPQPGYAKYDNGFFYGYNGTSWDAFTGSVTNTTDVSVTGGTNAIITYDSDDAGSGSLIIRSGADTIITAENNGTVQFSKSIVLSDSVFTVGDIPGGLRYNSTSTDIEGYVQGSWKTLTGISQHEHALSNVWDSIPADPQNPTTERNLVQILASDFIHTTGDESASGNKTFDDNVIVSKKLGVGVEIPAFKLDVLGAIRISDTTSFAEGALRYNSITKDFEGYRGNPYNGWFSFTDPGAHTHIFDVIYEEDPLSNPSARTLQEYMDGELVHVSGNEIIAGEKTFTDNMELSSAALLLSGSVTGNLQLDATQEGRFQGGLVVGGTQVRVQALDVAGGIRIGNTIAEAEGSIRYVAGGAGEGADIQAYVNSGWESLLATNVEALSSPGDIVITADNDGDTVGDILIRTGNSGDPVVDTKVYITNEGKFGIGTYPVNQLLEINGAILFGSDGPTDDVPGSVRFTGDHFQAYTSGDQGWMDIGRKYVANISGASDPVVDGNTWLITHNLKTEDVVMQISTDVLGNGVYAVLIPDDYIVENSNQIRVRWNSVPTQPCKLVFFG